MCMAQLSMCRCRLCAGPTCCHGQLSQLLPLVLRVQLLRDGLGSLQVAQLHSQLEPAG
jgi:hypothetical protein